MATCNACKNRVFLDGYCKKHYIFLVKNQMLDNPIEEIRMVLSLPENREELKINTCKICKRVASTKGYCLNHYWLLHGNNMIDKSDEEIKQFMGNRLKFESCFICGKKVTEGCFCNKHYMYLKDHSILGKTIDEIKDSIIK